MVSVAVSMKKTFTTDAISNVVEGAFPQFTMLGLRLTVLPNQLIFG